MGGPIFSPAALAPYVAQIASQGQPNSPISASSEPDGIGPWPYVAMAGGMGADALSTYAAGRDGAHEVDPLFPQNAAKAAAMRALLIAPEAAIMRSLANHGHPTAAKWLGYGAGVAGSLAALHNLVR